MPIDKNTHKEAMQWFNKREWAKGLLFQAHQSVDVLEFAIQYHKNTVYWDRAFAFLKDTDLEHIAPGKYAIVGEHVYASVNEGITKDLKEIKWEAHCRYIDIQYVVHGQEKMGIAPVAGAEILASFDEIRDIGFYKINESVCNYYVAEPGTFFIFFPKDAHRPGIKANGAGVSKKIVIKIVSG